MNWRTTRVIFGVALWVAAMAAGVSSVSAQTSFQRYRCADRTQFIVGFFPYDTRAHLQIDGQEVTLERRFTLAGARYSGSGVTLKISKRGTTIRHARRPVTACELT